MAPESVAEALRRSSREAEAFSHFYDAHASAMVGYAARRVFDVDTAVEITAETFAKAFLKRRNFRGSSDAEAAGWLYKIAAREIANYFRRSQVERRAIRRLGMQVPAPTSEDQERIVELAGIAELQAAVRTELSHLSEEQRKALQLRVIDELPYPEVASQLGITQQAARARVARGLKSLTQGLSNYASPVKEGTT